jgi:hypothetical protein
VCQHHRTEAFRTGMVDDWHDVVPLHQAGAQHSQSPVVTVMGGDGDSFEPAQSRRCAVLLTFEKLTNGTPANAQRHQTVTRCCPSQDTRSRKLGQ